MASEDERDAADGARPSTSGSAKRVKTAGGTKRKGKSSMGRKAKRDAADGARSSTRGSVKRVKKAGGTKLEVERNAAYGAMRVRPSEGTEVETNGAWTARIKVTAALKDAFDSVKEFGKFVLENPELILEKLRFALECWGIIKKFGYGSIILDLDCGSQEKFLEFQKDFENGKVKDAMETEFREIGYNGKLELKLMKRVFEIRPSTRGSARRESERSSNMPSEAGRNAANVGTESERSSDMANEAERNAANVGTEVEINGAWTARILVTTVLQGAAEGLAMICENLILIRRALQLALDGWGIICSIWSGSIIVDLDCRSQEKFLEFQKDFGDGKVKDAMETEFREIGYNGKLELKLMKRMFEISTLGLTSCAAEVKQEWGKEPHKWLSLKCGLTSCAAEVKQEWGKEPHKWLSLKCGK